VAFSVLLGNSVLVDILGIAIGHLYFFLEDVFPNQPGGRRLLATPRLLYATILHFSKNIRDRSSGSRFLFFSPLGNFCSTRTLKTLFTIRLLTSVLGVSIGAVLVLREWRTQPPTSREKTKISEEKEKQTQSSFFF
jgi:hypothetical protein